MISIPPDIELASRLLDVLNRTEFETVVHDLIDQIAGTTGGALSPLGRSAVFDVVSKTAVRTLPTLTMMVGSRAAAADRHPGSAVALAARVYGLELEGLSAEDRDFEIACQIVRFARTAVQRAVDRHSSAPAEPDATRAAIRSAARQFAPGLLPPQAIRAGGDAPTTPGREPT